MAKKKEVKVKKNVKVEVSPNDYPDQTEYLEAKREAEGKTK